MSFNWKNEIEKLNNAYERAIEANDTYAQERIAREIIQAEDLELQQMERERKEKYQMACHNLMCYSSNYAMRKPKEGFEKEWKEARDFIDQWKYLYA